MPILDVEIVGPLPAASAPGLAARLADAAGAVLGTPPQRTWVRLRRLDVSDYAENGGGPPADVLPVFVRVLEREPPGGDVLADRVRALTHAVAAECGRPSENVHVLYEPPARGRAAFGGDLVE